MHIQFAELPVHDQDRAKTFYIDRLGCGVVADQKMGSHGWRWIELKLPGAATNLHFVRRGNDEPSEAPVLVFVADDVGSAVSTLKSRGVKIITEPAPAPYDPSRTVAEFRDSEGNRIVVSS
ncbi:MAG: VOC family protein [Rhizobiaceae bacterium]|nr:VOC family protein [Rhizobiaceae bacterium]